MLGGADARVDGRACGEANAGLSKGRPLLLGRDVALLKFFEEGVGPSKGMEPKVYVMASQEVLGCVEA